MNRNRKSKNKPSTIQWILTHWKLSVGVLFIMLFLIGLFTVGTYRYIDSKSTSVGLKDIGELSTQSAIIREVNVIDESRSIFGMKVPFTNSKQLYSYEVEIKLGYDFSKIKMSRNTTVKTLTITLPKPYITSETIIKDSLKIYYDKQSVFTPIKLKETEEARQKMIDQAIDTAKKTKIYENARINAESLIKEFLYKDKTNKEYKIIFK